jgi:hypothetical protein
MGSCAGGPPVSANASKMRTRWPFTAHRPTAPAVAERFARAVPARRVRPAAARLHNVHDPGDHPPIIGPRHAAPLVGRAGSQPLHLRLDQPERVVRHRPPDPEIGASESRHR